MSSIGGDNALDGSYGNATGGNGSITGGGKNDELDKEAFLLLLVTQFQYQDPLNPMDDKEFIAQLAQFSALEQQMNMNENFNLLLNAQAVQTSISITDYIGKEVSARGYGVTKEGDSVSLIQYASNEELASCVINIMDSMGQVVATIDAGAQAPGIHDFVWDGKKSDGSTASDGVYTVSISGKNSAGEPVFVDTSVSGRVIGTSSYNGEYYLRLEGGRSVLLSNVREVVESQESQIKPGKDIVGTDGDDYLEGEAKAADTISAGKGNDIILYDGYDKLVDGGEGFDFIIADGDLSDNLKSIEAVLRGADAKSLTSIKALNDLGIVLKGDKLDMTAESWKSNWEFANGSQWTYKGDKKVTIEILDKSQVIGYPEEGGESGETGGGTEGAARRAPMNESTPSFSQALADGLKNAKSTVDSGIQSTASGLQNTASTTKQTLRQKASSVINDYMKGLVPQA